MNNNDFNTLIESIKQAGEIKKGERSPSRSFHFDPIDIKKIRENLHKTQPEFAYMIGISVSTLRNWEQGRRNPEGPARALLHIAAANPEILSKHSLRLRSGLPSPPLPSPLSGSPPRLYPPLWYLIGRPRGGILKRGGGFGTLLTHRRPCRLSRHYQKPSAIADHRHHIHIKNDPFFPFGSKGFSLKGSSFQLAPGSPVWIVELRKT